MSHQDTVIISELTKDQSLALPKVLKAELVKNQGSDSISHWSELAGLGRVVIVFKYPEQASEALETLRATHPDLKVHLSDSILPRHRSFDVSLEPPALTDLKLYKEPEPVPSLKLNDVPPLERKRTLLEPQLTLDTDVDGKRSEGHSPSSPSIVLEDFDF